MKLKVFKQIAYLLVAGVAGLGIGIAIMWNGPRTSAATQSGHEHELVLHAGVEATCEHAGVRDYWECPVEHLYYSDAEGTNVIKENLATWKVIPQVAHKTNENCYHAHVNASCSAEGHQAYYTCVYGCGKIFTDAKCQHEVTLADVTLAKIAHSLSAVAYEEATCEHDGHEAHYACAACGATFADAEGKTAYNPIIKTQHNTTHYDYVAESCEEDGHIAYDECETCHRKFDTDGNELADGAEVLEAKGHTCTGNNHVDAKDTTCTENGNPEYYICNDCGKYFYDADLTNEMDPEVLNQAPYLATGHGEYILVYAPENVADKTQIDRYVNNVGNYVSGGYIIYNKVCEHGCGDTYGYQLVRDYANLLSTNATLSYEWDANHKITADVYTVTSRELAIQIDVAVNCSSYSQYKQYDQNGELVAEVTDFTDQVVTQGADEVLTLHVQFTADASSGDCLVWEFDWDGDGVYEQTIKVVLA